MPAFDLRPIGSVVSPLTDASTAPRQPDEGAPSAWLHFDASVLDALSSLHEGDEVLLLTWLDRADRTVLRAHPRGDRSRRNLEALDGTPILDVKPLLGEIDER